MPTHPERTCEYSCCMLSGSSPPVSCWFSESPPRNAEMWDAEAGAALTATHGSGRRARFGCRQATRELKEGEVHLYARQLSGLIQA